MHLPYLPFLRPVDLRFDLKMRFHSNKRDLEGLWLTMINYCNIQDASCIEFGVDQIQQRAWECTKTRAKASPTSSVSPDPALQA